MHLPNNASIFSAEIRAIDLALKFIENKRILNSIIFCDSLSVLQSLHHRKLDNPLLVDILVKNSELNTSYNIVYCWLPCHIGIRGNEEADQAAKMALSQEPSAFELPFSDVKPCIKKYLHQKWQLSKDDEVNNKLHAIRPSLGE